MDYSCKISMEDYVTKKVQPLVLSKEQKKDKERICRAEERHVLRAVTMTLMWVSRQLRADSIGPVSLLTRRGADAKVEDLFGAGKVIDHVRETKELSMKIHNMSVKDTIAVVFADASPSSVEGTEGSKKGHGGFLVCLAHRDLAQHKTVPMSLMVWRSEKMKENVLPV